MRIEIPKVSPDGSRYTGEEPAAVLDVGPDESLAAETPLRYDLRAEIVSRQLVVSGRVEMTLRMICSRCGVIFSTTAENSSFLCAYPLREGQMEVDVTGDLRESILLSVPNHPRCSEECAGLCPRCGKNRNDGPCGCVPEEAADQEGRGPWDGLAGLDLSGSARE